MSACVCLGWYRPTWCGHPGQGCQALPGERDWWAEHQGHWGPGEGHVSELQWRFPAEDEPDMLPVVRKGRRLIVTIDPQASDVNSTFALLHLHMNGCLSAGLQRRREGDGQSGVRCAVQTGQAGGDGGSGTCWILGSSGRKGSLRQWQEVNTDSDFTPWNQTFHDYRNLKRNLTSAQTHAALLLCIFLLYIWINK